TRPADDAGAVPCESICHLESCLASSNAAAAVSAGHAAPPGTPDAVLAALDATIARARGSALYADRLAGVRLRSVDDLVRLPLTTRADLQCAGTHGTRA